jgi:biopolymer transport protein ExbB
MFEYFVKGGPIMWPLLLCSLISLTVIIERFIFFRSIKINHNLIKKFLELLSMKDFDKAVKILEKIQLPFNQIFFEAIENFNSPSLEPILKDTAEQQIPKLEKYLTILSSLASISTLLGFLGTVTGMIKAFESIAAAGAASPQIVSKGIAEALITTAAGLFIAIPTIIFYNYYNYVVEKFVHYMEHYIQEILDIKGKTR